MRPRDRGRMSATPICGQSRCPAVPSPVIAMKPPVYGRISMPSEVAQHHLQHGPVHRYRPVCRQHPFRVITASHPDRQRRNHVNAGGLEHRLAPDTGEHQQVCRLNRSGAQHDSVGGQGHRSSGADRVDSHCAFPGETQPHCPRLRQQGQVGPSQRGYQKAGAGTGAHAVNDVERDRAHSRRHLGTGVVEVGDPRKPRLLGGGQKGLGASRHVVACGEPGWGRDRRGRGCRNPGLSRWPGSGPGRRTMPSQASRGRRSRRAARGRSSRR